MNLSYYSTVQFQRFNCSIYSHELNELSLIVVFIHTSLMSYHLRQ
jgi:hypothetical protein